MIVIPVPVGPRPKAQHRPLAGLDQIKSGPGGVDAFAGWYRTSHLVFRRRPQGGRHAVRYDLMMPFEVSIAILNRIADSRLVLLNNCGHWPPFEKPAEWAAPVLAFLRGY
jgi:pimeloyl-ACP methyl ester carboxylesterase